MIKGQEVPLRGPEGPNRLNESHKAEPARPSQNRVRFQDPRAQESSDLSQLRLSAVEQEFRRRVEQYTSESEDEETKVSTIKRNGNAAAVSNTNLVEKDREAFERRIQEEKEREMKIEEKRKELEENTRQEERLLNEARRRVQTGPAESNGSTPPPLPNSPPPVETPPPAQAAVSAAPGTQRLDMLLGNTAPATLGRSKPKSETPTKRDKRVSFMPEEDAMTNFEYSSDSNREDFEKYDDNDNNISQENLDRLNAKEDPNAFIHEAETLLNSATIGLNKLDFNSSSTGHTPSVIGTQEIYKDPRSRMLLEQQEKKLSAGKPPDGAKLSFKEKMKLFAQEVGENTPRDKAKISKAQREIDGEGN